MSTTHIPAELRRLVRERAAGNCEYCLIPESVAFATHAIDHIVAEKHGGSQRPITWPFPARFVMGTREATWHRSILKTGQSCHFFTHAMTAGATIFA
jgi:hypothetical protein